MDQQTPPLVCASHTKEYIGMLFVGLIVGVGGAFAYYNQTPQANGNNSYKAGFEAAKKLVEDSPLGAMFKTPDDVRALSGIVTGISGKTITLHTQSQNPFEEASLRNRMVTVTADTKITKLTQKDPKAFQVEMDAFMKKMQAGRASLEATIPPEPFIRASAVLADVATGDTLNVVASENIKTKGEFTATEIQIQTKAVI